MRVVLFAASVIGSTLAIGCYSQPGPVGDGSEATSQASATEQTGATDSATTDPVTTGSATTDPVTTDPATTDSMTTGPATDPATTDPATSDATTTDASDTLESSGPSSATDGETGAGECPPDKDDDACALCTKENCCPELIACTANPDCACVVDCVSVNGLGALEMCEMDCGVEQSPAEAITLQTCVARSGCIDNC